MTQDLCQIATQASLLSSDGTLVNPSKESEEYENKNSKAREVLRKVTTESDIIYTVYTLGKTLGK